MQSRSTRSQFKKMIDVPLQRLINNAIVQIIILF